MRLVGWDGVGDDPPVGQRHRGAEDPAHLCHEGGTTEDARLAELHEPAKRGYVGAGGVADDALGGAVRAASFALGRHAELMVRSARAICRRAGRHIAGG
jgi:hypothetical protein